MKQKTKIGDLVDMSEFNDQGERMIEVYLQDRMTGQIIGRRQVKRAFVAKAFNEGKVVGGKDGMFKIEV